MLLGLAVVDSYVVINTVYHHYYTVVHFLMIHLLIVLCSFFITSTFEKKKYFINSLSLFLPGIGLMLGFFIKMFEKYASAGEMMDEYEEHIAYIDNLSILKDINIVDEINTMSVNDKLRYSSSDQKKEAVIDFNTDDSQAKVNVLRHALSDEDPEVVHYAAAMLNTIDKDFCDKLRDCDEIKNKNKQLQKRAVLLMQYIESGLLESDIKLCYLKKYLLIIEEIENSGELSYDLELRKGIVCKKLNQFVQAQEVFDILISSYPERYEAYTELMGLKYEQNLPNDVRKIANDIVAKGVDVPKEHLDIYKYWEEVL